MTPWALEVLCTLPCWPSYVTMKEMQEEFRLKDQKELRKALAMIGHEGFDVVRTQKCGERRVGIHRASWDRARSRAQRYWRNTQGKDRVAKGRPLSKRNSE